MSEGYEVPTELPGTWLDEITVCTVAVPKHTRWAPGFGNQVPERSSQLGLGVGQVFGQSEAGPLMTTTEQIPPSSRVTHVFPCKRG